MKITVYTVPDCKFSQAEKAYLSSKNIQFEEKNLEANRDFLTEMLEKSNNFAGTPVTEIVKDDGKTVVLKGYTQAELDAAISGTPVAPMTEEEPKEETVSQPVMAAAPTPAPAVQSEPVPQVAETSMVPPLQVSPLNEPTPMGQSSIGAPAPVAPTQDMMNAPQTPVAPTPDAPFQMPSAPSAPMQTPQEPQPFQMPQQSSPAAPAPVAPAPYSMPSPMSQDQSQSQNAGNDQLNSVMSNLQQKANS